MDCILSNTTVVQPDIVYVESSRSSLVSARGIEGPPAKRAAASHPSRASPSFRPRSYPDRRLVRHGALREPLRVWYRPRVMGDHVTLARDGAIATVTLNRP